MRLPFFFLLFHLLHLLHLLHPFHFLSPSCTLFLPNPALFWGLQIRDPPAFLVLGYVREVVYYLDVSPFTYMRAGDRALSVCARRHLLGDTDVRRGSNVGGFAVDLACLCRVTSVPKMIAP